LFTGLNPFNLPAYGLRACWPTLRAEHYCSAPKVWLLGGWLGLPRWASHPLDCPVLPGRFQYVKPDPCHLNSMLDDRAVSMRRKAISATRREPALVAALSA
jgi:hypothetical protein